MKPVCGERLRAVPSETQWLLARLAPDPELGEARWLLLVPLYDELFRFSLRAATAGDVFGRHQLDELELLGETGDPFTVGRGGVCLYVAAGADPYELCAEGARSVTNRLGSGRLRRDKPLPDFFRDLGWCTWDAFYSEVSPAKVREGLESFRSGGVQPRWLILDDGWQREERMATGERRLTSFAANDKFPDGLAPLVRMAKDEFAIRRFLVWHTIVGYWGGVARAGFEPYDVRDQARRFGEGILEHRPAFDELWWGPLVGMPAKERARDFFDAYHASLRAQGVDGVKVDGQAVLEGLATGQGGRVPLALDYRHALEASVNEHFEGRLLNCMANGQEGWYGSRDSTLQRSSIDFFPTIADSHGGHVYTNAQVGVWFGHFMQPDWDMFQSGHPWGAFHAAARAVSGGPVYVSDKPNEHDFALLRKLTCSDGSVLSCDLPGVPTLGCLCHDPTHEPVLLQIKNRNGSSALLGIFNCQGPEGGATLTSRIDLDDALPSDITATEFACYAHQKRSLQRVRRGDDRPSTLAPGDWELYTLVPIENEVAAVGLIDKLNSRAAVTRSTDEGDRTVVQLRDGGRFLALTTRPVSRVECAGADLAFSHDSAQQRLEVEVPEGAQREVAIYFA